MRSSKGQRIGSGRLALEIGLGACALWLLVQNLLLVLVIGPRADWAQMGQAAKLVLKLAEVTARALWPWPAVGMIALLLAAAMALGTAFRSKPRRVRHA